MEEINSPFSNGFNIIRGTSGDDELVGNHHDILLGLGGDDILSTADGDGFNVLKGGSGDDELEVTGPLAGLHEKVEDSVKTKWRNPAYMPDNATGLEPVTT